MNLEEHFLNRTWATRACLTEDYQLHFCDRLKLLVLSLVRHQRSTHDQMFTKSPGVLISLAFSVR